jgi:hypothetical protein
MLAAHQLALDSLDAFRIRCSGVQVVIVTAAVGLTVVFVTAHLTSIRIRKPSQEGVAAPDGGRQAEGGTAAGAPRREAMIGLARLSSPEKQC